MGSVTTYPRATGVNDTAFSRDAAGNILGVVGPSGGTIPLLKPSNLVGCIGDSITQQCVNFSASTCTLVPTITAGGSGYAVSDSILLPNGVLLQVSTVSSGAVTGVVVSNTGTLPFTAQASAQAQVATTGAGTGFTATLALKGSGGLRYLQAKGYAAWAQVLSGSRALFPPELIWGFPSQGTAQVLTMLPYFIQRMQASGAQTAVVHIGTNDVVSQGRTYAAITADLQSIYRQLVGNGILVIAVPILPRAYDGSGDTGLSATLVRAILRINIWICNYCRDNVGMYLADPTLNFVDLTSSTGYPKPATTKSAASYTNNSASMTYDGLHPISYGARWVGKAISDVLTTLYTANDTRILSVADLYNASVCWL